MRPRATPVRCAIFLLLSMVEGLLAPGAIAQDPSRTLTELARLVTAGRSEAAIEGLGTLLNRALDTSVRIDALSLRAQAYRETGYQRKALQDLRGALNLITSGDRRRATLQGAIAGVLVQSGQLVDAAVALDDALASASAVGDQATQARVLNDIGTLQTAWDTRTALGVTPRTVGWPETSIDAFTRSARIAADIADAGLETTARLNLARVQLHAEDVDAALESLEAASTASTAETDSSIKVRHLLTRARLLATLPRGSHPGIAKARFEAVTAARNLANALGDARGSTYALGYLGELYADEGRLGEATRLTEQALFAANSIQAPGIAYLWQAQLGRLREASKDHEGALTAYRNATVTMRAIRSDLVDSLPGPHGRFEQTVRPVFESLVDLLLRRSESTPDETARQAMLGEARATMELFKSAELEEYFRDDCVTALQAKERPIDALLAQTAVVYPIALKDRLELLVTLEGRFLRRVVDVSRAELAREARLFRTLVEKRTRQYRRPGRKLYDWLVRPIAPELAQMDTVVFIPGSPLRSIPFGALYDGERHLIESHALAVAPGLSLLDPGPLQRDQLTPLIAGISVAVQGFDELPFVERELDGLQALIGGDLLKNEQFLQSAVTGALDEKPYSVVHIASHAEFGPTGDSSFLLTYDGRLTMDGLERFIKLSRFRERPVELLTLSACETAAGDERAALGLAGIAVKAGARSTLASLWPVYDEAATELILRFHRHLLEPGTTKAVALRYAQMELLHERGFRYPVSWAPFVLIGSWL